LRAKSGGRRRPPRGRRPPRDDPGRTSRCLGLVAAGPAAEVDFLDKEQLLAEIEETIKTMPPRASIRQETQENVAWFGRVSAGIEKWDPSKSAFARECLDRFLSRNGHARETASEFTKLLTLLHQARNDLRLETPGPSSVAIGHQMVFQYFEEIRKIIELARQDLLFVDPYLDADFVGRYLPHVAAGVTIRLLARENWRRCSPQWTPSFNRPV
jgi:hypothetical protein